jgi:hypothetical protein
LSRLRIAISGLLAAAAVAYAMDGPHVVRVIVEKKDGTTETKAPPEPRVLRARAIPGPQELARLAEEKTRPARPARTVVAARPAPPPAYARPPEPSPEPSPSEAPPPPVPTTAALAAPVVRDAPAPVTLTARDRESLRWLKRLAAKYPERFARMMQDNPRARWLVDEELKLTGEQRRALHTGEHEHEDEAEGVEEPAGDDDDDE